MFQLLVIFTLLAGKPVFREHTYWFSTSDQCEDYQSYAQHVIDRTVGLDGVAGRCEAQPWAKV